MTSYASSRCAILYTILPVSMSLLNKAEFPAHSFEKFTHVSCFFIINTSKTTQQSQLLYFFLLYRELFHIFCSFIQQNPV